MIIAGVNGGGTKTEAMCCDESGRILGKGSSGASNYQNIGLDAMVRSVKEALSGATKSKPDIMCVGLAGINTEKDRDAVYMRLSKEFPNLIVEHDAFAELYGETRGGNGIMVIAGTGSIVLGYDGKRRYRRCDSGWFLGDEGSGYMIGKEGLRITSKMLVEDFTKSKIAEEIMKSLALKDAGDLMGWAYSQKNNVTNVAALAKIVCKCAQEGDKNAEIIVKRASSILADATCDLAMRIGVNVAHIKGGLFNSSMYYSTFSEALRKRGISAKMINESGAEGAMLIAADKAGIKAMK